ncbi:MAG: hypothetical protein JXA03_10480, partial [Bacteroidales bacterium]|nr:hypothetical protein [Bacteroidales bacterium]
MFEDSSWCYLKVKTMNPGNDAVLQLYADDNNWAFHHDESESNDLNIRYNNSVKMTISKEGNMGVGTMNPHASAILDASSTSKGFLPPRMNANAITSIQNPANGLMVFNTSDNKLYIYVASAGVWKEVLYGTGTLVANCPPTLTVTHTAGAVAPVNKTVSYGTVMTNLTGSDKCWITKNLGADQQATSATDATEASAGWYWQFNKKQGYKHDGTTRTPNTTWISSINEYSDWQTANDPCAILLGAGWRLPTVTEWSNAVQNGGWSNYNHAYASVLKLHAAGYLYYSDGSLNGRGTYGHDWSSTQDSSTNGWRLAFNSSNCSVSNYYKTYGFSGRCLRD